MMDDGHLYCHNLQMEAMKSRRIPTPWLSILATALLSSSLVVEAFAPNPTHRYHCHQTSSNKVRRFTGLHLSSTWSQRRGVEIPLLDFTDQPDQDQIYMQPLPSNHLPDEVTTVHIYGMQLTRPLHQMVVDDAIDRAETSIGEMGGSPERIFGHVAYKPDSDSLVGAIGCTAQILISAPTPDEVESVVEDGETPPRTVLCRGSWRFVVREVVKTIPFPVVIVDELLDDEPSIANDATADNDGDDDPYASLTPSELVERTLEALKTYVDQQVTGLQRDLNPLEQSMVVTAERQAAEEAAAVYAIFVQSLPDICTTPGQMYYAISFLAAELTNLSGTARRHFLRLTDGVDRLRLVLGLLENMVGMATAQKISEKITTETDEASKDLEVGEPILPPWAKSIKKGTRLEYYWNEDWDWCEGEVVEEPIFIVNELILMVHFDQEEDDSVHRLPFSADEKVRWRPPQPKVQD